MVFKDFENGIQKKHSGKTEHFVKKCREEMTYAGILPSFWEDDTVQS